MNPDDPMAALRDIHLPAPPEGASAWPVMAAAVALVLAITLATLLVLRLRRGWARQLRQELTQLDPSDPEAVTRAAQLLRRAAIARYGSFAVRLQGNSWLSQLDDLFRTRFFSAGDGQIFGPALYAGSNAPSRPIIAELCRLAARRAWSLW